MYLGCKLLMNILCHITYTVGAYIRPMRCGHALCGAMEPTRCIQCVAAIGLRIKIVLHTGPTAGVYSKLWHASPFSVRH